MQKWSYVHLDGNVMQSYAILAKETEKGLEAFTLIDLCIAPPAGLAYRVQNDGLDYPDSTVLSPPNICSLTFSSTILKKSLRFLEQKESHFCHKMLPIQDVF